MLIEGLPAGAVLRTRERFDLSANHTRAVALQLSSAGMKLLPKPGSTVSVIAHAQTTVLGKSVEVVRRITLRRATLPHRRK